MLRSISDNMTDLLWAKDLNNKYIFANQAICDLLLNASSVDEPVGKDDMFFAQRERERHKESPDWHTFGEICLNSDEIVLKSNKPGQFEEYGNVKGKFLFLDVRKSPLFNERAEIIGTVGSGRDVTHEKEVIKQLRESEERMYSFYNSSPNSVMVVSLDDNIIDCNQETLTMHGYTHKSEIRGKKLTDIMTPDSGNELHNYKNSALKNGNIKNVELIYIKKDGDTFPVNFSMSVIKDAKGDPKAFIIVSQDITLRKKTETELIEAKKKAEESDRLKSAFLANMSHEIRTPMNGIIGFARMMKKHELSEAKRNYYANIIMNNSQQLLSVLNDVLDISRIETGKLVLSFENVVVNELIMELFSFFKPQTNNKTLSIIPGKSLNDRDSTIITDRVRLKQVLTNLLNNAVKFTFKGHIKFGYKLQKDQLLFYIEDTGIGIKRDQLSHIFERFHQAELEISRHYGGAGLGLSISQKIVELLGGKIWVESELQKGSTFYFTIPYKPIYSGDNPADDRKKNQIEHYTGREILLVEDEITNFLYMEEVLSEMRIKIIHASDGLEAVEICRDSKSIDLVLMDIKLPVMDGYEATRKIKKMNPDLPVIAITAYAMSEDKSKALAAGCDDYLSKPVNIEDLLNIINVILE